MQSAPAIRILVIVSLQYSRIAGWDALGSQSAPIVEFYGGVVPADAANGGGDRPSQHEEQQPMPPTGRQAAWNYLVFALSKSSTLIMTVVLARILVPAEFGLFAFALLVVNLFDYIKDLGVGAALVQSPRKWNQIAPTGLTLSVMFAAVAGLLLLGSADIAARILGDPELVPVIRVLAIGVAISALSVLPMAWLRRKLDFRSRLLPEFLGALAKMGLTIGLAVAGLGVWSLVYGQLAAVAVTAALYWRVAKTKPRFGFDVHEARLLIRFGVPVSVVTLLAFAIYNVDYLAIGARLNETDLGLYVLAYRLPELVVLNLCIVISEVLFSSLSSLQNDRKALADHYLQAVGVVVALTAPIGAALAVLAPAVIATLYGPKYSDAAPMLAVLALYAVVYSASFHSGDVYKAIGRPGILTAINLGKLAVMVGPVWWAAGHNAVLVAVSLLGVEVIHFIVRIAVVQRVISLKWSALLSAVFRPTAAAAFMGVTLLAVERFTHGIPAPAELVAGSFVGVLLYLAALRFTAPHLFAAGMGLARSTVKSGMQRGTGAGTSPDAEGSG